MSKAHDRNRARRRLALRIAERVCEYLVYNEREFDLEDVANLIEAMIPLTRAEAAHQTPAQAAQAANGTQPDTQAIRSTDGQQKA